MRRIRNLVKFNSGHTAPSNAPIVYYITKWSDLWLKLFLNSALNEIAIQYGIALNKLFFHLK